MNVTLPAAVGRWKLAGPAKRVEPKAIFNYMDGAGELYLGYRFQFLDVFEYEGSDEDQILVELYWMETSDDAWGLLSGDWDGERLQLDWPDGREKADEVRALYGAGLLRLWSGNLYGRVLAYQETEDSKAAVLSLGKAIIAGRAECKPPRLIRAIPQSLGGDLVVRPDRLVFLRSHLVLNSVYFLSQENLLDLGLKCELAAATYRPKAEPGYTKPIGALLIRYPDEAAARKALHHFQKVYLPGHSTWPANDGTAHIEDGWLGFVLSGRALGLIFEAPNETTTHMFIEQAKQALDNLEVSND